MTEKDLHDAIEKAKKEKTPCDWCDREAGVETHKLNSNRICDKHSNDIIEALASELGLWI